MKVYKISTLARPNIGRFDHFAILAAEESAHDFIGILDGNPFQGEWKKQKLFIENPKLPRPDFYTLGIGKFVCNVRVRELVGEHLEMSGELLPVKIEGEKGDYWLYNATNCINSLDRKKSKWRQLGKNKADRLLDTPAFLASRFGEECLFKIPEDGGGTIYCLERSDDPDDGEFKASVEHHGLTGLEFNLVWNCK